MKERSPELEAKINKTKHAIIPENRGPATSAGIVRSTEELVQIGPRLPRGLVDKLNVYSKLQRVNSQDIVREALENFFSRKKVPGFD